MSKPNYIDIVRQVKADLTARGINVDADECARFGITRRVAYLIGQVDPSAGLLYKPTGNNCEERAVDIICWQDGTIVDILGAGAEGPNTPLWQENPNPVDPSRWRAAPMVDAPPPTPEPVPPPPPAPTPAPGPTPVPTPVPAPAPKKSLDLTKILVTAIPLVVGFVKWWRRRAKKKTEPPSGPTTTPGVH